jgi:ferredoxin
MTKTLSPLLLISISSQCIAFAPIFIGVNRHWTYNRLSAGTDIEAQLLSLELEKPLGMILEEVEESQPKGVYIKELAEGGSASSSEYRDLLVGCKIATVMGQDVTCLDFDSVMSTIVNAPSRVLLELAVDDDTSGPTKEQFPVGTTVTINVIQSDKPTIAIQAKVGDNLRTVLLDNNVEVYRGLKQKMGNCGGAGQCTFCAADFVESEGWEPRSEYEASKLKRNPNARLSCLNNIQGPATIKL